MRDALAAVLAYLSDDMGAGVTRIAKRIGEINTAWTVSVDTPRTLKVGYDKTAQFPSIAILPSRIEIEQTQGGHPSLTRTHQLVIGVACGDLDDAVVLTQILAYNKAIQGILVEDGTLGGRVSDCSQLSADFADMMTDDQFYRTIDLALAVRLKPSESDQV